MRAFLAEVPQEPFSDECAVRFGAIKADLLKRGKPISDFDIAIAATALATGRVMVSKDSDLRKVRELTVQDWTT